MSRAKKQKKKQKKKKNKKKKQKKKKKQQKNISNMRAVYIAIITSDQALHHSEWYG